MEFGESLGMLEGVESFRKRPLGSLGSSFGGILKHVKWLCVEGQNMRLCYVFLNWKCCDYARHIRDRGEKVFRRHKGQSKTRCHPKNKKRLLISWWV